MFTSKCNWMLHFLSKGVKSHLSKLCEIAFGKNCVKSLLIKFSEIAIVNKALWLRRHVLKDSKLVSPVSTFYKFASEKLYFRKTWQNSLHSFKKMKIHILWTIRKKERKKVRRNKTKWSVCDWRSFFSSFLLV